MKLSLASSFGATWSDDTTSDVSLPATTGAYDPPAGARPFDVEGFLSVDDADASSARSALTGATLVVEWKRSA